MAHDIETHVLIIEDDELAADMLRELLCGPRSRFACQVAGTLAEGLAALRSKSFDVVLLDLGLPDSSGIETAATLRRAFSEVPIIVLTGLADEGMALNALRIDIQDYIVKGQISGSVISRSIRYAIERKKVADALRESEEKFRAFFESAAVGTALVDVKSGRFLQVNDRLCQITGYDRSELLARTPGEITESMDRERDRELFDALIAGRTSEYSVEKRYRRKNGTIVWVQVAVTVTRDSEGRPFQLIGLVEDIDKRKRLEQEIRQMALHDPLTGLPNRRLLQEVANVELAQARRNGKKIAVLFLDLDRFKEINDTLGHETGDRLLKETAIRLKSVVRTSDTVARIGGDEFNVLLPDIAHPEYSSEAAQKILNEIRKPFRLNGHELIISTSIGISVFPDDSEDFPALLRYADIAMYYAKEHGRNRYQFYSPVITTRWHERLDIKNSLRRALENGEFILYFQPLINIETDRPVSIEALLRWRHPERGLLLPGQFFGAADDIGLMGEIDEWVLKAVSGHIRTWQEQGIPHPCVTVNVSARQFQSRTLIGQISRLLDDTGLRPGCLEIDITETTAMRNLQHVIARVRELMKLGVQVSIDDFGTGFFSLNHLKRLPIRKLKIDRSFVRDLETNSDDRAIVTAVLVLAHAMNLKVVAEGVEGMNQLEFLRGLHCDEAQGFFLGAPMPAEKIRELVR